MDQTSRRLVEDAQRGDAAALEALLARHYPALRAFIRLRLNSPLRQKESSSDLAQSVCRDVLVGLHGFEYRGESSFKAWLFKSALNKIRKKEVFYRALKRDIGLEVDLQSAHADPELSACYAPLSPSNAAAGREAVQRLEAAFEALPEDYREVLTLARIAGLSHAEIAAQMDRSVAASRVLLSRALARLASVLKGMQDADSRRP